jgi:hypothetical protein
MFIQTDCSSDYLHFIESSKKKAIPKSNHAVKNQVEAIIKNEIN